MLLLGLAKSAPFLCPPVVNAHMGFVSLVYKLEQCMHTHVWWSHKPSSSPVLELQVLKKEGHAEKLAIEMKLCNITLKTESCIFYTTRLTQLPHHF